MAFAAALPKLYSVKEVLPSSSTTVLCLAFLPEEEAFTCPLASSDTATQASWAAFQTILYILFITVNLLTVYTFI
nr:hypothetical protein [Neisseria subflava]